MNEALDRLDLKFPKADKEARAALDVEWPVSDALFLSICHTDVCARSPAQWAVLPFKGQPALSKEVRPA